MTGLGAVRSGEAVPAGDLRAGDRIRVDGPNTIVLADVPVVVVLGVEESGRDGWVNLRVGYGDPDSTYQRMLRREAVVSRMSRVGTDGVVGDDGYTGMETWWLDHRNLARMAEALHEAGDSLENILYMINKPWKYTDEFRRAMAGDPVLGGE